MTDVYSDCRSEDGITIGLVDSLIRICRVLKARDLSDSNVGQALKDLAEDEDFNFLVALLIRIEK
jgi:hypothetical protein